jgi:hypothetical protein
MATSAARAVTDQNALARKVVEERAGRGREARGRATREKSARDAAAGGRGARGGGARYRSLPRWRTLGRTP